MNKPILMALAAALAFLPLASLTAQSPAPAATAPGGKTVPPEIIQPAKPSPPPPTASPTVSGSASPPHVTPGENARHKKAGPPKANPHKQVDSLSDSEVSQAINFLKSNFVDPNAVSDPGLARATLQGLIERLAPGAAIVPAGLAAGHEQSPLHAEIVEKQAGYLRLGSLSTDNIAALDSALQDFTGKSVAALVLDLRATPSGSDYEFAAEVLNRFCPKGKLLFSIKKAGTAKERLFTSTNEPRSTAAPFVVLVDRTTSGAAEVIAADLRLYAKAMVIGEKTAGEAVEYSEYPLGDIPKTAVGGDPGKLAPSITALKEATCLKLAVAQVTLPENQSIYQEGLKPDIMVEVAPDVEKVVLELALSKGVVSVVQESEPPHSNEHSLVTRTNPELDAIEAAQRAKGEKPKPPVLDAILQRALDLITSIHIYEAKPPPAE